eukprot:CAMPEP_0201613784 /NCGR_PEP_ID=MMETSP0492-20130828/27056_1 /ASSEMBLY_ACC=CAM_ASM_000837 /TAXON_ID=420259 /ORGANISM="Thalassiosira gravida, Strain GMp14c1" /LENGTH=38 /DNA_ID= /DNA_START= /DNA_END= /DNA_ORIENTATION=
MPEQREIFSHLEENKHECAYKHQNQVRYDYLVEWPESA